MFIPTAQHRGTVTITKGCEKVQISDTNEEGVFVYKEAVACSARNLNQMLFSGWNVPRQWAGLAPQIAFTWTAEHVYVNRVWGT